MDKRQKVCAHYHQLVVGPLYRQLCTILTNKQRTAKGSKQTEVKAAQSIMYFCYIITKLFQNVSKVLLVLLLKGDKNSKGMCSIVLFRNVINTGI